MNSLTSLPPEAYLILVPLILFILAINIATRGPLAPGELDQLNRDRRDFSL